MQTLLSSLLRSLGRGTAALMAGSFISGAALAASGTWTETTGDGAWSNGSNWQNGTVADGAGFTADFNGIDVDAVAINNAFPGFYRNAIQLDGNRTIGSIIFGDANTNTPGGWEVYGTATNLLTLSGGTPTITVHPLGPIDTGTLGDPTPELIDDAIFRPSFSAPNGLTKAGAGTLTIDNNAGSTYSIVGGINVTGGKLRLLPTAGIGEQPISLANGTTIEAGVSLRQVTVAAGGTATVRMLNNSQIGGMLPAGPNTTLNLRINATTTVEFQRDWAGFENLNIVGEGATPVPIRGQINSNTGANNIFNGNSFATTNLHLDNASFFIRTNSQGNLIPIGALTGSATGTLSGGNTGTAVRYEIGGLNTSTTFDGIINGAGGLSINKVGTGTLTMAGTFAAASPAINSIPARQGGVFRVTTGTLKFTGVSSIPGGPVANPTILTTIDVLPGATFDVASAPSTFTTSTQQKIQGGGTILGNWNHVAGQFNPGDVGAPTAANENNLSAGVTPTGGTLTFQGDVTMGGGNIVYDMALAPGPGNDLVQVNGTATLSGGGRIIPNFLNGVPAAGQTYTVLSATGGISGPATNMTVDYAGRGVDPIPFITGNNLQFTTPAGGVITADLVWAGTPTNTWDVETSQAWTNGGSPDRFFNFDDVTFTEAAANKAVTVASVVRPNSLEINNTSDYTFTGAGSIADPAGVALGLTKTGGGALNVSLNNTFTGPASVTGSTVNVAGTSGLGVGPLTLNNATYIATVSVSNSSLDIPEGTTSTIQLDGGAGTGGTANIPSLTGGGTLNLVSTVADKYFGTFNTAGFTGTLNVAPSGAVTDLGEIRIRGGQTDFTNAVVNLTATGISNQQGAAADSVVTVGFGEVHADSLSNLTAFVGGSIPPDVIWEIGAKNTNSNIDGIVADGIGNGDPSIANIRKVGTGTLTLAGANTYGGFTRIDDGILSISQPIVQATDVTTDDVFIYGDGILNLAFSATDQIDALYVNNTPQAVGTYGRVGHPSATFKVPYITGDGILEVLALGPALGLTGDYNNDGTVDAADYTVWRNNVGQPGNTLLNRDPFNGAGPVAQIDYDSWKANFGATSSGSGSLASVPEPASWLVAMLALVAGGTIRRR